MNTTHAKMMKIALAATVVGGAAMTMTPEVEANVDRTIPKFGIDSEGNLDNSKGFKNENMATTWTSIIDKYRFWIVGISGIAAVSMILFFIINFMKLGAAQSPQSRSQAIGGLIWTGLAAAGLGSVAIIVGLFYNALG